MDPTTTNDGERRRKGERDSKINEVKKMGEGVKVKGGETTEGRTVSYTQLAMLYVASLQHCNTTLHTTHYTAISY